MPFPPASALADVPPGTSIIASSPAFACSGTSVPEINRLLKQYQDMAGMMKKMKKLGQRGLMRHGLSALMPGGGFRH